MYLSLRYFVYEQATGRVYPGALILLEYGKRMRAVCGSCYQVPTHPMDEDRYKLYTSGYTSL